MLSLLAKVLGLVIVIGVSCSTATAGGCYPVPEIDPASASSALALVGGLYLLARDKFCR